MMVETRFGRYSFDRVFSSSGLDYSEGIPKLDCGYVVGAIGKEVWLLFVCRDWILFRYLDTVENMYNAIADYVAKHIYIRSTFSGG